MADKKKSLGKEFTKGLLAENPVLRLVLGTCPTLAVSTSVVNAIGKIGHIPIICRFVEQFTCHEARSHTRSIVAVSMPKYHLIFSKGFD